MRSLLNATPEAVNSKDEVSFNCHELASSHPRLITVPPCRIQDGRSPLHWAASGSSLELTELLLKNTPAPNLELKDGSGSTPLIVAGKFSWRGRRAHVTSTARV